MSKIIAVDGPPSSGKSTVALKLAQEVYALTHKSVLYINPDIMIPCMGILFPSSKQAKLYSIGAALDRAEIVKEDIMKVTVTSKYMENFGYLGYKTGEDLYTYPTPTDDKIDELFNAARIMADYIFIDCDRNPDDLISVMGRGAADQIIQVINPDLRSMSYYGSKLVPEGRLKVMNVMDKDLYLPINETVGHYHGVDFKLPYSRAVKQQGITGTLPQFVKDPVYRNAMSGLAKAVI